MPEFCVKPLTEKSKIGEELKGLMKPLHDNSQKHHVIEEIMQSTHAVWLNADWVL